MLEIPQLLELPISPQKGNSSYFLPLSLPDLFFPQGFIGFIGF
jgi:hypothetical protein